jgi:predicted DsbA family dithiol-disulfide isomerase
VVHVAAGTIVMWSDIACPWATLAVHRLVAARRRLGMDGRVVVDHRAFPLEVVNGRPTPRHILDAEIPVAGGLEPGAGWQIWRGDPHNYPVTTLLALEAVQAAKEQSLWASEQLDHALRMALFAESRCISMRHVILDVAVTCDTLDADLLEKALDGRRARGSVFLDRAEAHGAGVEGSPHLFLPDGTSAHNPGISVRWLKNRGEKSFPVVDADDPAVYEDLLRRAVG